MSKKEERYWRKLNKNNERAAKKYRKYVSKMYLKGKILLIKDGSIDTDRLEEIGIPYIVYRQGSKPPRFLGE